MFHSNLSLRACRAALIALLIVPAPARAERDEVVVTASRLPVPRSHSGSTVATIRADDIARARASTIADLLRAVPGVAVARTGPVGGQTSVFLRGTSAEHVLVLVDGLEVNDPSSPNRAFDFANLSVENVDRIEVVSGAQSPLYGSDAIGGVIQIFTRRGRGPLAGQVSAQRGTFDTREHRASVTGGDARYHVSLGVRALETDGFSAARADLGNTERDGYDLSTTSLRLGGTPHPDLEVDGTLRTSRARADLDRGGGAGQDDPDNVLISDQTAARLEMRGSLLDDRWEQTLAWGRTFNARTNADLPDRFRPLDSIDARFRGSLDELTWKSDLHLGSHTLTAGFEREVEDADSTLRGTSAFGPFEATFPRQEARTHSAFVQDLVDVGRGLRLALGGREDRHSRFGQAKTYRVAVTQALARDRVRLRASRGTGFKAPSLFQLFSQFGNPDLRPEQSVSEEAGLEWDVVANRATVGFVRFDNDQTDLITSDPDTFALVNIGRARIQGSESTLSLTPGEGLRLDVSYSRSDPQDLVTGQRLLRRPRETLAVQVAATPAAGTQVNVSAMRVGARRDVDFSPFPTRAVELAGYTLVTLSGSHDLGRGRRVFARVDNLFDEQYEEVFGFGVPGASLHAGLQAEF